MRSSNGPSKLFVGDIGNNRKSDLNRLFSKYGEISTIYIDDNKHFGFVEFISPSDAQRALRHTNNKTVNGSRLRVEYAKSDKASRDNRPPAVRERSPASTLFNHLQVTANRLPSMQAIRQSYYQYHPATMMASSVMPRGRSLTPPSFKQNARLSSMNHLRTQDFYPPVYSPHSVVYPDSSYYRTYGDPYLMQRLPPPPPSYLPPVSSPPPSSLSSYRNMYSSSGHHRNPPETSHRRTRQSCSRGGRRSSKSRKNPSSRERERKRKRQSTPSSSSSSSSKEPRERGPQTPPPSHRAKKRSRSGSDENVSTSEQKSASDSSSEDETSENKQSKSKRFQDNDSSRKHSKRKIRR
ncbi:unnamed protein product [Rotaria socialis]|uniref:RRM domain-containing protein n=1 Tax=Rotaria socialis TaxID=392032 RepID=A0A817UEB6_9BILA|nr:unnamed protein product [Rotaria socialis]CAF3643853.1 unnamed protein product [Rotaria socialis]CAF4511211.1 unnamed protein product [Rotaria socialis]CAF4548675.1 unnamed protein product [Rotaria socialis]